MLDVLLLPPQQRSAGNRRKYNAGNTKRVDADHVGGHSNVVARDQPKQQRGRHRGSQTEESYRLFAACDDNSLVPQCSFGSPKPR